MPVKLQMSEFASFNQSSTVGDIGEVWLGGAVVDLDYSECAWCGDDYATDFFAGGFKRDRLDSIEDVFGVGWVHEGTGDWGTGGLGDWGTGGLGDWGTGGLGDCSLKSRMV